MSLRTVVSLTLAVGVENSTDSTNLVFSRTLSEMVDSFDHAQPQVGTLGPGESNTQINLGDVAQPRLVYIEADRELDVVFGGSQAPEAGVLQGVGAAFPTGFAGGEVLDFSVDGVSVVATFEGADQTITHVVNRLNAAAALQGLATPVWSNVGGQLRLQSTTTGLASSVSVTGSVVATALGFASTTTDAGENPTPNTSSLSLKRLVDLSTSQVMALKVYALLTVQTTALYLSNPDPSNSVKYTVCVVGDLTAASC
jgi:hypothetical protein